MQKHCPIDGTPLMEMNKNGVTIDVCPECKGVWLDRGELEKLIQVALELEREFNQPAAPRQPERPRAPEYAQPDPRYAQPDPRYAQPDPRYAQPQAPYRRDDDDDDRSRYDQYGKKKKSALGKIFDIFD